MHVLRCPRCRCVVSFPDLDCAECAAPLGFQRKGGSFTELSEPAEACANRDVIACNWLRVDETGELCASCRLTRTRPADRDTEAIPAWRDTETAKRRLLVQLDALGLPVPSVAERGDHPVGLAFDLLSSTHRRVTTGHANGVITLDLAEGDDVHRESMRQRFGEPYRTLLGHLRHEIGHFYWLLLVQNGEWIDRFRALFGDERENYQQALREHYAGEDDQRWTETHVTRYAAAHPWEDWAESFAQYLHIQGALDTARAWGFYPTGPYGPLDTLAGLLEQWLPLSRALNALSHSMGQPELYPFSLAKPAVDKLQLVHDVITGRDGT